MRGSHIFFIKFYLCKNGAFCKHLHAFLKQFQNIYKANFCFPDTYPGFFSGFRVQTQNIFKDNLKHFVLIFEAF